MIKRFTFRLERVLRHRANIQEMRERELAEVEGQLLRERNACAELASMRDEVLGDLARLQEGPFASADRGIFQLYVDWLGEEITRERRIISDLTDLSEAKRQELIKASQDRRIVERLKERKLDEHNRGIERLDQQGLDEIATNEFARDALHIPSAPLREKL